MRFFVSRIGTLQYFGQAINIAVQEQNGYLVEVLKWIFRVWAF